MDAPMDLDELKQAWQSIDQRLQKQEALQQALLRERKAGGMRRILDGLAWEQISVAVLCMLGFLLSTSAGGPEASTALTLSALVCSAYFLIATACLFWVMQRIGDIDYAAPVTRIQQRLAVLRKTYVKVALLVGLPWLLLWLPFAMVSLDVIAGIDLGQRIGAAYWLANVAFAIIACGLLFVLHRWTQRKPDSPLARLLRDLLSGRSLRRAQAELDALQRYCEE
jgi:hypothetical protein